jgi:hypothetical protein
MHLQQHDSHWRLQRRMMMTPLPLLALMSIQSA